MAESFLPLLARPAGPVARPGRGPRLVVAAANLAQGVHDVAALGRAVAALDADVVSLVEHTEATAAALAAAGWEERWPHVADDRDEGYFGSAVASRFPITAADRRADVGGRRGLVVDLDLDGTAVRVVPVHTQAPVQDRDVEVWHGTVEANAAVADEVAGPVVLAGDWNATGGHRRFRRSLVAHGLVDAQAVLHRRWQPTWPVAHPKAPGPSWVPPVLPLDHVVVRAATAVEALEVVALPGTDHRALRATLRL